MTHTELLELLAKPHSSFLGRLLDASPIAVAAALDSRIVYANPACAVTFGYQGPERMVGRSFFDMIAPESIPLVQRLWHTRPDDEQEPWVYELVGVRASGDVFRYRCTSTSLSMEDGRKATFAFMQDLAPDAPAEQALRARSAEFLGMLEA